MYTLAINNNLFTVVLWDKIAPSLLHLNDSAGFQQWFMVQPFKDDRTLVERYSFSSRPSSKKLWALNKYGTSIIYEHYVTVNELGDDVRIITCSIQLWARKLSLQRSVHKSRTEAGIDYVLVLKLGGELRLHMTKPKITKEYLLPKGTDFVMLSGIGDSTCG